MSTSNQITEAVSFIQNEWGVVDSPIGVILGTGLGDFAAELSDTKEIAYTDIPYFPQSTVEGHDGKFILGRLKGKNLLVMKGRFHFYEGYDMSLIAFPIRVLKRLGVELLLLSNASGGVNPDFEVGDIMIIDDHINLMNTNPLIGKNEDQFGPRFPDMSEPYSHKLIKLLEAAGKDCDVCLKRGVYVGVTGPCFETPAEYRYIRRIGGDAVGMSTVPENIVAKHAGMEVAALSVITDLGIEGRVEQVSHEEVQKAAHDAEPKMASVVKQFLTLLPA